MNSLARVTTGNSAFYGSLLIQGVVSGTGTPDIWFDEKLIKGSWAPPNMPRVIVYNVQTDEEHPSAAARARDRRRRRLRCSACLDHNVEPLAGAELEKQLGEIHAGRIRSLRRAERRCSSETLRVDVDRNDPSRDGATRCPRDDERADPPRSDHCDALAGPYSCCALDGTHSGYDCAAEEGSGL